MLTVKDVAQELQINYYTAYDLIRDGDIQSTKVGKVYRIRKEWLDDYINGNVVAPPNKLATRKKKAKLFPLGSRAQRFLDRLKN